MKTNKLIFLTLVALVSLQTKAQLKVTTTGVVLSGGSTSAFTSVSGLKTQVLGNGLFSTATTTPLNSAAYIVGNSTWSGASAPDYTWYGDLTTGIYHPSAGNIFFAAGGVNSVSLNQYGIGIGGSPVQAASATFPLNIQGNEMLSGVSSSYEYYKIYIGNSNKYIGGMDVSGSPDMGIINKDGSLLHIASTAGIAFWGNNAGESHPGTGYNMFINQYGVGIGPNAQAWTGSPDVNFYLNGNGYVSGSFAWSSDKRFKKNINNIDKALDKILKLNGKNYEYNKEEFKEYNFSDGKNLGFIAQELMEVLPEAVIQDNKGYYGINYIAVIPVLVEAIKEQHKTIEAQQNDIQALKNNAQNLTQQMSYCCQAATAGINNANTSNTISNSSVLYQNVPNPFSENTDIAYNIVSAAQKSTLYLFDMQGTLLKTYDNLKPGNGKLSINGGELNPGMYLYSLLVDGKEIDTKRMILTK